MTRVALLAVVGLTGCASPLMRAAEGGDPATLGRLVAEREKRGDLSNAEAASLARAVADRDLRAATGPDALALVRDVRSCAHELDPALAYRMRAHDAAGAEAALARIEADGLEPDDVRALATDPDAAWRAVGARALVRSEDREARLKAILDGDPRVRRQAVRAAGEARDPNDLAVLADAARLDPEPIVRTEAVRAMVQLYPLPSGELADDLRDLWPRADEGLREDIALAWASPQVWDAGGSEALRVLVASGHGPGIVEGAAAVLRNENLGGDVVIEAIAQLERAIQQGSRERRLQAIASAPLERPELLAAVRASAGEGDLQVRVGALGRLAGLHEAGADRALVELARPGSPVAARARFALAAMGDRRVQAWLEQDLQAPDVEDRLAAGTSLATLGVAARAAPLLAEPTPAARVRAACTLLVGARRQP